MNRVVFRVILAVVALALLAIPALADINGDVTSREVENLVVDPELVVLEDSSDTGTIEFEAQNVSGVDDEYDLYLVFDRDDPDKKLRVRLDYDGDEDWTGTAEVDKDDVGTWDLIDCYYLSGTSQRDINCEDASFEVRFAGVNEEVDDLRVEDLVITPDPAVLISESDEETARFEAESIVGVNTDEKVTLVFERYNSDAELKVVLSYNDNADEWRGSKIVDEDDLGTWDLADCYYDDGDADELIYCPYDSFRVQLKDTDDDDDDTAIVRPGTGNVCSWDLAPKQLRASVGGDTVTLTWQCFGDEFSWDDFAVQAGWNAGNMTTVKSGDYKTVRSQLRCTLDIDALEGLADNRPGVFRGKANNKNFVLVRVKNEYGRSNVVLVPVADTDDGPINRAGGPPWANGKGK